MAARKINDKGYKNEGTVLSFGYKKNENVWAVMSWRFFLFFCHLIKS